jgi:hypothetical protein
MFQSSFSGFAPGAIHIQPFQGWEQALFIIIHGLYPWLFKIEALQASAPLIISLIAGWYEIPLHHPMHDKPTLTASWYKFI